MENIEQVIINIISKLLVSGREGEAPSEPLISQSAQTELRPPENARLLFAITYGIRLDAVCHLIWQLWGNEYELKRENFDRSG